MEGLESANDVSSQNEGRHEWMTCENAEEPPAVEGRQPAQRELARLCFVFSIESLFPRSDTRARRSSDVGSRPSSTSDGSCPQAPQRRYHCVHGKTNAVGARMSNDIYRPCQANGDRFILAPSERLSAALESVRPDGREVNSQ